MPTTPQSIIGGRPDSDQHHHQHIPCPRCESSNTKFCYYNNYNLSQPRHFCKSCRRYWTHGGTLRNIPVGGGTRKSSNKRLRNPNPERITPAVTATATSSGSSSVSSHRLQLPAPGSASLPVGTSGGSSGGFGFTSLLNSQVVCGSSEYAAMGGFGLGLGPGFEDLGFGLGRGVWPYHEVGVDQGGDGGGDGSAVPAWGGEHVFGDGDYGFGWPDLAISMSGRAFK